MNAPFKSVPTADYAEVGQFRRIGERGPAYEVRALNGDDAEIVILESGETLTYPVSDVLGDPIA